MAHVPQRVVIFNRNASYNIYLKENKKIEKSLIEACSLDFIYSSISSNLGESGSSISGGQRQRIGIARAIASNPKLLFLDEAFNGIDLETSIKILSYIKEIQITTILISHNINHLNLCDRVIKLTN